MANLTSGDEPGRLELAEIELDNVMPILVAAGTHETTSVFHSAVGVALIMSARLSPKLASHALRQLANLNVDELSFFKYWGEVFPDLPNITTVDLDDAKRVVEQTLKAGIAVIPVTSEDYPKSLGLLDDCPPVIYCKGSLSALEHAPGLAVVGTRKATDSGVIVAERISRYFAEKEWVIVSGLALGIDSAAHRGALSVSGRTIAVLAHGLGTVYPKQNARLAERIMTQGGLLLSEYPLGISAKPEQFVLRNRLQIGLSAGSVIVEGEEKSGTRTQAEYCLKNKRHLFAVIPTDETAKLNLASSLPLQLVAKRGATPICSRADYDRVELMIRTKKRQLADEIRPVN
jgi:DNA processing protein